jgi:hypothetical protein
MSAKVSSGNQTVMLIGSVLLLSNPSIAILYSILLNSQHAKHPYKSNLWFQPSISAVNPIKFNQLQW